MSLPQLPPVIVGAGPAGLACAATLVEAGLRPILLEEARRPGGQGTRRLSPAMMPFAEQFLGRAYANKTATREALEDRLLTRCDWRPGTLAWGIFEDCLEVVQDGRHDSIRFDQLLVAVGATDRLMALPGWTLPGVFTLGGAQVALKQHSAFIGQRVVMAGSSPLLYLAAVQYARMGLADLTVVDTSKPADKRRAAIGMALSAPTTFAEGLLLLAELRRKGVRRIEGAELLRVNGTNRVEAIEIRHADGRVEALSCDAVALGHGLRPETQLAELAGAKLKFDPILRNWFPETDEDGRAGDRLWLAGDSAMTGGRIAAAESGRLAAYSMLSARGMTVPADVTKLRRSVAKLRLFQQRMASAFRWPSHLAADLPDETIVCRCERVHAGAIREAVRKQAGPVEVNRVKAVTRCGMGRCQGRFCGQTLQELTAVTSGVPVETVGRLRAQAPVRPIPIEAAMKEDGL
ncbi:NAD(P)/FAD-dependent oxidoreductase [Tianweitania sp.]|uniref:FAD/NAD(P)-dependent oxidoreductase n=1 Tax=Tianweitania sp. TaxID=2021634 RepID=UPI00289BC220|nr:NAD(P)/FAD-dependent oxidoreductase [Tianweitania sp.]